MCAPSFQPSADDLLSHVIEGGLSAVDLPYVARKQRMEDRVCPEDFAINRIRTR